MNEIIFVVENAPEGGAIAISSRKRRRGLDAGFGIESSAHHGQQQRDTPETTGPCICQEYFLALPTADRGP